ncbi:MAG TPA: DUF2917 domain-containing protein [Burkholderiales bacterium]
MPARGARSPALEDFAWHIEGRIALRVGELLRIGDGKGWTIAVIEGRIWITQEGDTRDIVIAAGAQYRVERAGLSLVHALCPSGIVLHLPLPGHRVPRLERVRPQTRLYCGSIFASST